MCPSRGVLAGDVFAMSPVIAFRWTTVVRVATSNPRVDIRFYVDDAQLQYIGTTGGAVGCLFQAATDLFTQLEGPLALKINQARTVAVGSEPAPVVSLCRLLRIDTGAAAGAVRNLGSDLSFEGVEPPSPSRSANPASPASFGARQGLRSWPRRRAKEPPINCLAPA